MYLHVLISAVNVCTLWSESLSKIRELSVHAKGNRVLDGFSEHSVFSVRCYGGFRILLCGFLGNYADRAVFAQQRQNVPEAVRNSVTRVRNACSLTLRAADIPLLRPAYSRFHAPSGLQCEVSEGSG